MVSLAPRRLLSGHYRVMSSRQETVGQAPEPVQMQQVPQRGAGCCAEGEVSVTLPLKEL